MLSRHFFVTAFMVLASVACIDSTGPQATIGELHLSLRVSSDTVVSGAGFTLTVLLRNAGDEPLVLSGSGCQVRHSVTHKGRDVAFLGTKGTTTCAAAGWKLTLLPGEERQWDSQILAAVVVPFSASLPGEFTVHAESTFDLVVGDRIASRQTPKLRGQFVLVYSGS